jgi:outer membrane murein-binding lipoprotein Lpp
MSEDLTDKLPGNNSAILKAIQDLGTKVDRLDSKVDSLESKVNSLETKVDQKLHDTRPIWHKVVADIAQLQAGQTRLEEGQQAMRAELMDLSHTVRTVNRDQIVFNDVIRRIQLDFHNVDERLHRLTINRNPPNPST